MNFDVFRPEQLKLEETAPADAVDHHQVIELGRDDGGRPFGDAVHDSRSTHEDRGVDVRRPWSPGRQSACGFRRGLSKDSLGAVDGDDAPGFLGAIGFQRGIAKPRR